MTTLGSYPIPIKDASQTLTWAFNTHVTGTTELTGFADGNTGLLFALNAYSNDITSASGYYVRIGTNASEDPVQLVKLNGGYTNDGDFTVIAEGLVGDDTDYYSIRVTYNPNNNEWSLYAASNPNGFPYSDPRNVPDNDQQGSTTQDNALVDNDSGKFVGIHFNHSDDTSIDAVFDDLYVSDPGGELPVEFARFDAVRDGEDVQLQWATASETGNAGFAIQQKVDGTFVRQGFVQGTGTTQETKRYSFTVENVGTGTHAFRLKQVDTDGTAHYSDVRRIALRPNGLDVTAVGANPAQPGAPARYRLAAETSQKVTVTLYDALGRRIERLYRGRVGASGTGITVSASDRASGIYLLRISSPTATRTKRVAIVR